MSPMSLLNLPASSLRDGQGHEHASPCGERSERRLALWALAGMAAGVVGVIIFVLA